jgi:hypothetical protein
MTGGDGMKHLWVRGWWLALGILLLVACGEGGQAIAPAPPVGVTATPGVGVVRVAWSHDGQGVEGFVVYRELRGSAVAASEDEGPVELARVGADDRAYDDESVESGARYAYAVAALGAGDRASAPATDDSGSNGVAPMPEPDPDPDPDPDPIPIPIRTRILIPIRTPIRTPTPTPTPIPDPDPDPDPGPVLDPTISAVWLDRSSVPAEGGSVRVSWNAENAVSVEVAIDPALPGLPIVVEGGSSVVLDVPANASVMTLTFTVTVTATGAEGTEPAQESTSFSQDPGRDPSVLPTAVLGFEVATVAPLGPFEVTFDASGSFSGVPITDMIFDPGDGSSPRRGTFTTLRHEYGLAGTYTASLRIFDEDDRSDTVVVELDLTGGAASWTWGSGFQLLDGLTIGTTWRGGLRRMPGGELRAAYGHGTGRGGDDAIANLTIELQGEQASARLVSTPHVFEDGVGATGAFGYVPVADGAYVLSQDAEDILIRRVAYFPNDPGGTASSWSVAFGEVEETLPGVGDVGFREIRDLAVARPGGFGVVGRMYQPCLREEEAETIGVCFHGRVDLIDATGARRWSRLFAPTSEPLAQEMLADLSLSLIEIDADGSVVVAGELVTADWRGREFSSQGIWERGAFVALLDDAGNERWQTVVPLRYEDRASPDYKAGSCTGFPDALAIVGDAVLVSANMNPCQTGEIGRHALLTALDRASGEVLWQREYGRTTFGEVVETRVLYPALNGDVIAVFQTDGADFIRPAQGQTDTVLRRYTPAGEVVWTRQFSHSAVPASCQYNTGTMTGLTEGADGSLYLMGFLTNREAVVGVAACEGIGVYHPVIWRLTSDGRFVVE